MPESSGPGLYRASKATISSNLVGCSLFIRSLIPDDSSWKTAIVLPELNNSKTLGSFKGILLRSISFFELEELIDFKARSITVSVLRPKKSNLTKPIFSTSSLSN